MDRLDIAVKRRGKRYLVYPVVKTIVGIVGRRKSGREEEQPIGVRVFHNSDSQGKQGNGVLHGEKQKSFGVFRVAGKNHYLSRGWLGYPQAATVPRSGGSLLFASFRAIARFFSRRWNLVTKLSSEMTGCIQAAGLALITLELASGTAGRVPKSNPRQRHRHHRAGGTAVDF
jgi:hypothetical protein